MPFGEYVPLRGFFSHLADLSAGPADAVPGTGTGLLPTPVAPLGAMVSYEVFYADRGRSAVRDGAQLLIVPTNTSSYATSQVPTQEIAASRGAGRPAGPRPAAGRPDRVQRRPSPIGARCSSARSSAPARWSWPPSTGARARRSTCTTGTCRCSCWPPAPPSPVGSSPPGAGGPRWGPLAGVTRSSPSGCTRRGSPRHGTWRSCWGRPRRPGGGRSRGAQFVDAVPLEPGHLRVVTAGPHDQQVPPQSVAFEPRQRLGLHPHRSSGQQDHLEAGSSSSRTLATSSMTGSSPQASKNASQSRRPRSR